MESEVNNIAYVGQNGECNGALPEKEQQNVFENEVKRKVLTYAQLHHVDSGDVVSANQPTCDVNCDVNRNASENMNSSPLFNSKNQSCLIPEECMIDVHLDQHSDLEKAGQSNVSGECLPIENSNKASVHQFFLPSDDEVDGTALDSCVGVSRKVEKEAFCEPGIRKPPTVPSKTGVQFCGPHHVFTVVPVSGELGKCDEQPQEQSQTPPTIANATGATDGSRVSSVKNLALPSCVHYSPYNTVRTSLGGRRLAYSPYHTVSRIGQISTTCNPYHTITGLVPTTYQRSESGLRRVISSKRDYGVGGSSIPPSLLSVALPQGSGVSLSSKVPTAAAESGLQRVRTLPCPATTLLHVFPEEGIEPYINGSDCHVSSEHATVHSINQMTVRSAGGLSIDVGSTDGRNVKIHGAVESPEQLPLLPSVHGDRKNGDTMREEDSRQKWENKAQFMLACIGNAVGLGNMWRFPYFCYKSGGGAFLVPYFLMLFLCGIPLLLMEVAVGQYTQRGPISAMGKICPLFKGTGVGMVVISFLLCTYYNVILGWIIYYLFQSFFSELPWSSCNATWAVNCFDDYGPNVTAPEGMKSVTEEFFDEVVLDKTNGIHEPGELRLSLLLTLFIAWTLVYFALWKSIRSSGRVVYVTATLPYVLISAFVWRALTLPGASRGLQYFFNPRWEFLLNAQVWVSAAAQNFNSIGITFGSMIAFSSYNKFNNNIVIDTWCITLTNSITSLLAGTIVFATLGNIALEQGKDIDDVVAEGPGLVFVVYPQALAKMPHANVWAVLFFSLMLILGVDSQFATVEVIVTSIKDAFPNWVKKYLRRHEVLVLLVCFVSFLLGLPNITQGGIYFFTLIDYYTAAVSLMYLAFFEVVAIVWIYGADRLARNVQEMTGRMPSLYFRFCWYFAAPLLILTIWVFSMIDYERPSYNKGEYTYPNWAIAIGWLFTSCSIAPIPVFAVIAIVNAKGNTLLEKMRNSIKSPIKDCPCCGSTINSLDEAHTHSKEEVMLVVYTPHSNNDNAESADQLITKDTGKKNVV